MSNNQVNYIELEKAKKALNDIYNAIPNEWPDDTYEELYHLQSTILDEICKILDTYKKP